MSVDEAVVVRAPTVVGVDGSEPSRRALRWPAFIAQPLHASMEALIRWKTEGESLTAAARGDASETMMAHRLARQPRNPQTLVEIGVDKDTAVVFPEPLMTTIAELGSLLARESAAAKPTAIPRPAIESTAASPVKPAATATSVAAELLTGRP